ncbi:MAG TPA: tetratricopeptide repeat protein [Chitinophagaceae bacterium]
MKKGFILMIALCSAFISHSQTMEDGKKSLYYQKWLSAEKTFRELIRQQPQNIDAHYWLMQALIEQNKLAEAKQLIITAFQQTSGTVKQHPLLNVAQGELMLHDSLVADATQKFEEALKDTRQKDPDVMTAIVRAHLNAKRTDYAYLLDLLEKAEKRDKNNPEIFNLQGEVYRRSGDGGKAVQAFTTALQKDEGYARADYNIGRIYLTQQNSEMFLKHFTNAVQKDPSFGPALYELYYYYYFRDVNLAKDYLDRYIASRDPSVENEYMLLDLLYVSSKHTEALEKARRLLAKEKDSAQPRLYKLIAYSYDALKDSVNALDFIGQYFQKAHDTQLVARDFELRASLLQKFGGREQDAIADLEKAIAMDTVAKNKADYMADLAAIFKRMGDKSREAHWLGQLYQVKEDPTNLDLYYWGLAHYSAQEYPQADTVFGLYTEKYPDHIHGFYWRAKSTALIDTSMELGLAVPHYKKVIELAAPDSIKNKTLLIQAYGYVGAYEANVQKDFEEALAHFDKILELDPQNADALKYSDILKKWVKNESGPDGNKANTNKPELENKQ